MPANLSRLTRSSAWRWLAFLIAGAVLVGGCGLALNPTDLNTTAIQLATPDGTISFNDFVFDAKLGRLVVPAASTGQIALIDPDTLGISYIAGFSVPDPTADPANAARAGTISAAVVHGLIYALDEGNTSVVVADPTAGKILGSTPLQSPPDYIRYVAATNELWVTERSAEQIEVFKIPAKNPPIPVADGVISVPSGPEALVIDKSKGLAYTNEPNLAKTVVIQVQTRGIIAEWGSGCSKARGLALDEERGMLFVACKEGKVVMMDTTNDGVQVASANYGGGLDDIGYNPRLRHVYVPSNTSGIMGIFGVDLAPVPTPAPSDTATPIPSPTPESSPGVTPSPTAPPPVKLVLTLLGTADTGVGDNRMTTDDHDRVWIGNPSKGQILLLQDGFPAHGDGW